jgi:hypothetical protein
LEALAVYATSSMNSLGFPILKVVMVVNPSKTTQEKKDAMCCTRIFLSITPSTPNANKDLAG